MTSTHDELALAAAYVLGALDAAERRAFDAHVAVCAICREEVRSLQHVADALAYSVPAVTPGADLRARILGPIVGDAAGAGADRGSATRPRVSSRLPAWLPLAAAIVIAVGLGAQAWRLQGRLSGLETRLVDAERRAAAAESDTLRAQRVADDARLTLAVFAAPDLARIDLAGLTPAPKATGRALWSRNRGMVFTTANLPPLAAGRVYQVWVVTAQAPVSAGLISTDSSGTATAFFQTPPDIPAPVAVAVTVSPAGGLPAPEGDMYLIGKPAL
jgi:anti-sigma-K factor RskA